MNDAKYDQIINFYLSFVQHGLGNPGSVFQLALKAIYELAGDLSGKKVCDLACGEGYLSRMLAEGGAEVTGVDISPKLLDYARQQTRSDRITYVQDDAQVLGKLSNSFFDVVICNLALMDIPGIQATFQAVHRILKREGTFILSILHPCFETPFRTPENPIETDEAGNFIAVRVMRYFQEGYWNSGGDGMRGRVGAYHRTVSTYVNTLLDCSFHLTRLSEPALSSGNTANQIQKDSQVPSVLVLKAVSI